MLSSRGTRICLPRSGFGFKIAGQNRAIPSHSGTKGGYFELGSNPGEQSRRVNLRIPQRASCMTETCCG